MRPHYIATTKFFAVVLALVASSLAPWRAAAAGDPASPPPPATPGGNGPSPFPSATPQAVVEVTGKVFPSVVRLDVAQEIYSDGKRTVQRGIGSGVIIDAEGRILTNYHVAGRAAEIHVTLFNKERVPAKLVGDDHWTDLRSEERRVGKKWAAAPPREAGAHGTT